MTEDEKREYAKQLIRSHAKDIEFTTIFEMHDGISDEDARDVDLLLGKANVEVWFDA